MKTRRLQAYASLAEIISALAIIASLLYVGYEFRRTSTISSREADLVLFERGREANRLLIESPGLAEIVVAAASAPEKLSEADRLRFLTYQHDFFDSWEIGWYYHADGILDTDEWLEWNEWFTAMARRRPAWAWTENRQNFTGPDFRQHVDEALAGR
ncbi:MAG: hypothetical protein ABFS34_16500 [Gemmatimonadota bacterium]